MASHKIWRENHTMTFTTGQYCSFQQKGFQNKFEGFQQKFALQEACKNYSHYRHNIIFLQKSRELWKYSSENVDRYNQDERDANSREGDHPD